MRENIFTPIGVHPFEKIDSKNEKNSHIDPLLKKFPALIMRWFVTKWNPEIFPNAKIVWLPEVLRFWEGSKLNPKIMFWAKNMIFFCLFHFEFSLLKFHYILNFKFRFRNTYILLMKSAFFRDLVSSSQMSPSICTKSCVSRHLFTVLCSAKGLNWKTIALRGPLHICTP